MGTMSSLRAFQRYADSVKEAWFGREKPSIAKLESTYWNIVEQGTEHVCVAYGNDIDTAEFGSAFPLATSNDP